MNLLAEELFQRIAWAFNINLIKISDNISVKSFQNMAVQKLKCPIPTGKLTFQLFPSFVSVGQKCSPKL